MEKEKKVFENVEDCKKAAKAIDAVCNLVCDLERFHGWEFYTFRDFNEGLTALSNYVNGYLDALSE